MKPQFDHFDIDPCVPADWKKFYMTREWRGARMEISVDNPDGVKSADSYNRTLGYEEEYKVSQTPSKNSIDRLIRDAKNQADHIVLWIDSDISLEDLSAALRSRVRRSDNIRTITIVINGKDVSLTRAEIVSEGFKIRLADLK